MLELKLKKKKNFVLIIIRSFFWLITTGPVERIE